MAPPTGASSLLAVSMRLSRKTTDWSGPAFTTGGWFDPCTTKGSAFDVPPPGPGFTTVTENVASWVRAEAGMLARSSVGPMYAVVRAVVPSRATEAGTKPDPSSTTV